MAVERITDPICEHGEGPVWSAAWGGLRWVDLAAGDVMALDHPFSVQRWHVGPAMSGSRCGTGARRAEPEETAAAGALFRVAVGVRGVPVRPFLG